ncbi:O-antigen polymerase [Massilimicrobiota timonensis]|uniref:Oligosaccharide repeat unit polymerase n=1 Tax=Massilimicrobiota timonensis TaxID=1776392 RepID=A0A1Y4STG6_9FIRM|nr:O-antigen polymerase [Massilimicrobiota timonensis]OUQ33209.1 hypothetical protein B5E75_11110 [Massilimicrobiota timonensis]
MSINLFIIIIEVLIFAILTFFKFNKIITLNNLFNLVWTSSLILNIVYSYYGDILKISNKVINMVIVVIFFFNITYLLLSNKHKYKVINIDSFIINYNLVKWFFFISLILYLPNLIDSFSILISSGFSFAAIRSNYLSVMGAGRGVYVYITQIIPNGICNTIMLISSFDLARKNYSNLKYSIILMLVNILCFGGRGILLNFIIYYIISLFLFKSKNQKININKKIAYPLTLIIIVMTFSRGTGDLGFFGMLSKYFYQQFSFFELIIENPSIFDINNKIYYGYITLGFVFAPIALILSIFKSNIQLPSVLIDIHSQIFYNIGTGSTVHLINNNTTSLYTYIMDFGINFYFIGSIILAILIIYIEKKKTISNKNIFFYNMLYVYMIRVVLYTPLHYNLNSISTSLTMICLYFITRKVRVTIY